MFLTFFEHYVSFPPKTSSQKRKVHGKVKKQSIILKYQFSVFYFAGKLKLWLLLAIILLYRNFGDTPSFSPFFQIITPTVLCVFVFVLFIIVCIRILNIHVRILNIISTFITNAKCR